MQVFYSSTSMERISQYWVINLDRRKDRMHEFNSRVPFHSGLVNRVSAIDGLTFDPRAYPRILCKNKFEIACMMTHVNVWRHIASTNSETDLHVIFEDDVHFDPAFLAKWSSLYAPTLPSFFHIAYIGGRFFPHYREQATETDWYRTYEDRTFHSYIVTKAGAQKMVSLFQAEPRIVLPIDDLVVSWNRQNRIVNTCTAELLCWSPRNYKTDIQRPVKSRVNG